MSKTAKHTPGPWKQQSATLANNGHVFCGDVHIADCINCNNLPPEEAETNAKLIAAAPDMAEALMAILEDCNELSAPTEIEPATAECYAKGRAALAKAGVP